MRPLRIFVSYRRGDSGHAGRLYDALAARFGGEHVFMDIDAIDPGVDFAEVISREVSSCDVVLALIGRGWVEARDAEGRRRLDEPDDFVRLELESALDRDIVVIPTCVQGAPIPLPQDLPPSLAALSRRQGIELRDVGWHEDVARLIRRLERLASGDEAAAPAPPPRPRRRRLWPVLLAGAVVLVALAAGVAFALTRSDDDPPAAGGDGGARDRLLAFVPPVTRSTCEEVDWGDPSALVSVVCSGARLAVIYQLFPNADVMNDWYVQKREEMSIEPGSGACTGASFRGEVAYREDGEQVGSYFCFVDSEGESELFWTDARAEVGSAANVWEGKGRPAIESLLRQWDCCLQLQPPGSA